MSSADLGTDNVSALDALLDLPRIVVGHRHIGDLVAGAEGVQMLYQLLLRQIGRQAGDGQGEHGGVH